MGLIDHAIIWFASFCLSLRYRMCVRGLAAIRRRGRAKILFLPNHPSLIDPVMMMVRLARPFGVRAVADRRQIDRFVIRRWARRFGVIPIESERSRKSSVDSVRRVLDQCIAVLARGENLLLYPAGQAYRTRLERLGPNSAVERILREVPDVRIVLIRIRGLWGSRFSWASGRQPDVRRCLLRGIKQLLASGIFFAPRRRVTLEFHEPPDFPRRADRRRINRYLEAFYNQDAPPATCVPATIWQAGRVRPLPEPSSESTGR